MSSFPAPLCNAAGQLCSGGQLSYVEFIVLKSWLPGAELSWMELLRMQHFFFPREMIPVVQCLFSVLDLTFGV